MDYPKSVPNVGLVGGKFVDENTSTGQVGSLIPATWGNAVTDEILAVIEASGMLPDETDNTQLKSAIIRLWTCPYQTGHQFPVKLMPLPSA